ncbi:glycosyltransferase family 2 protein [Paenibacillus faecalis]|uniref:glycosyltransferase family 2 protein n=1 Tax=Paenibacillus faecalis TaxID=2079532 RepID=UPI001F193D20|nr:glycosyltransferase family 2 protein [Paenibacillus faecalis]
MIAGKKLIIVPAYNEENSIGAVIQDIYAHVDDVDVLVIDDGSTDRTAENARFHGAKVLTMPFNVGIGGGMQTGYRFALKHGYDVAVQMDADGQHCARELPKLFEQIEQYDLVIGSRYLEETAYRSTMMRRIGMIFFTGLLRIVLGQQFTDTTSGFRAANRKVIGLYADYYPMDYPEVESIVYLKRNGCRITEVKTEMRARQAGRSSITPIKSIYYMIKVTLSVIMCAARLKEVKPR